MKIQKDISKAIKSRSWLSIEYQNQKEDITKYWIAITDINLNNRSFSVDAFNMSKMSKTESGVIHINSLFLITLELMK
ncbi:hypothetical protein BN85400230 [Alteracholeplasma palmae J233]|uniref:Uncharacterized protein n=1 Tax=Alteracholeplasma palmae (strain ATCC 49389 / J233) TaxID=1318466 RepID=U4KN56_ALTPJ|nr:hypothetical protein [Alteracholeplasma palmae]CCV63600.1 hypothetical protein BN85400230 [Alteracholeplasma palmae J233]